MQLKLDVFRTSALKKHWDSVESCYSEVILTMENLLIPFAQAEFKGFEKKSLILKAFLLHNPFPTPVRPTLWVVIKQ